MLYTIYRVIHKDSGKVYIGKHQTLDLDDGYMGSGRLIRRAVKKYGPEAFEKEVLHVFETEAEMNDKEAELVTEDFCSREDTYNLCPGGNGGWGYINLSGRRESENRIKALRQYNSSDLGRRNTAAAGGKSAWIKHRESLLKASSAGGKIAFLGKKHSAETKAKMSVSISEKCRGSQNSQFGTMWITDGIINKKIPKDQPIPNGWSKGRKM